MTSVYLEQDGDRYTVAARGHATGSPETCAAVSTLMFTAAGWLRNTDEAKTLGERLEPGDARLEFIGGDAARAVYEAMMVGFLQLREAVPEAVKVDIAEI